MAFHCCAYIGPVWTKLEDLELGFIKFSGLITLLKGIEGQTTRGSHQKP